MVGTLNWDCNTTILRLTRQNVGDHIFSLVNFIMVVPLYGAYLTHDAFSRASNNKIYRNQKYSNSCIKIFFSFIAGSHSNCIGTEIVMKEENDRR